MPFAMCCSPKAAVSRSEDAGCVVENDRRGTRTGRERAGARLRRADEELLGIMAVVAIAMVTVLLFEARGELAMCGRFDTELT